MVCTKTRNMSDLSLTVNPWAKQHYGRTTNQALDEEQLIIFATCIAMIVNDNH
jgi:hypothetical protein